MAIVGIVNCHIKCDWQWFWPNYLRLSLPQYLRLDEKIQETGLLVIPYRLAMIGQWARLFTQYGEARKFAPVFGVATEPNPDASLQYESYYRRFLVEARRPKNRLALGDIFVHNYIFWEYFLTSRFL
jgi:hypothetical protein